jgi:hypothetical protein
MTTEINLEQTGRCGLYITLDGDFIERYSRFVAEAPEGSHAAEVVIEHNDRKVEMTFAEFLARVGLM